MSGYLPLGADNDPSAPYNQERKFCFDCDQELIEESGEWVHQFGGCPVEEEAEELFWEFLELITYLIED